MRPLAAPAVQQCATTAAARSARTIALFRRPLIPLPRARGRRHTPPRALVSERYLNRRRSSAECSRTIQGDGETHLHPERPNLNLLGVREPEVYGHETLTDLERRCRTRPRSLGLESSSARAISRANSINWIQEAPRAGIGHHHQRGRLHPYFDCDPRRPQSAADSRSSRFTSPISTSANRFATAAIVSPLAMGVICGFGGLGYEFAIEALRRSRFKNSRK